MTRSRRFAAVVLAAFLVIATSAAWLRARGDRSAAGVFLRTRYAVTRAWVEARARGDRVHRDLAYVERPGWQGRLDLYLPARGGPHPVVIYFHGGGWASGTKELAALYATAHRRLGYAVANVEYRRSPQARAPAAVQDAVCAVRWIAANSERFKIDRARIVTAGHSAGGHLALMAALTTDTTALDADCEGRPARPSGVLNWYGPSDLSSLLEAPDARGFTAYWLGDSVSVESFLRRMSPISLVTAESPMIFTVHGARDALVPLDQSQRLHSRLRAAGVRNALVVLPGHGHGFEMDATNAMLDSARAFLGSALPVSTNGH